MLKKVSRTEKLVLMLMTIVTVAGFILSYTNHDFFEHHYVNEDGFVEWMTVMALLAGMVVCIRRVWALRGQRPFLFLLMISLLALLFLFGAGEEASWGQRMFGIESSEFFQQNNTQGETNLHNLVVGGTKINELVFSAGLGIVLFVYLAVVIPLYRRMPAVRRLLDRFAIPIATNYQVAAIILTLLLVQVSMNSSRKPELLEFAGSFLFLLIVAFPENRSLFQAIETAPPR